MLNHAQQKHFSEHGWLIREGVFDHVFMDACKAVMDETAANHEARARDDERVFMMAIANHHQRFRDCLLHPVLLEDSRQLMGTGLRHRATWMIIKQPHAERHDKRDNLVDPDNLDWHRDMRPKWGTFPHDDDPELMNCILIDCMIPVTDIGPDDGGTMVLDGSHMVEGDAKTVMAQCPVVQFEAPRGSVIYFSETLMHTAVPILSEQPRYVMFYAFVPPWFEVWQGCDVPQAIVDTYDDEALRSIIGGNDKWGYVGQNMKS